MKSLQSPWQIYRSCKTSISTKLSEKINAPTSMLPVLSEGHLGYQHLANQPQTPSHQRDSIKYFSLHKYSIE